MKKFSLVIIVVSVVLMVLCILIYQDTDSYYDSIGKTTKIKFDSVSISLKKVQPNKEREVEFCFINAGEEPLIIYSVDVSCNCTKVESPKRPIMPHKESKIVVLYKSDSRGKFHKTIRVFGNFEGSPSLLTIHGECI